MIDSLPEISFFAAVFGLAMGFHWLWGEANHHARSTRVAGVFAVALLAVSVAACVGGALTSGEPR